MIGSRPPSLQRHYDDYWSGDPAFVQPPSPPDENASDEDRKAYIEALKEHAAKIKRARETGDWSQLIIDGQSPTKFVMRPIRGAQWRWLVDESTREDAHRMGPALLWQLMFRCACVRVVNCGTELPDKPVGHRILGTIAPVEITDYLDALDASIVAELGAAAFERARQLNPLS